MMKRSDLLMIATATAIGLALLAPTFAAAQERGGHERPEFSELDVDGDGQITEADLDAAREARFAEVDTDGDGQVSRAEFEAAAAARAGERAGLMFDRLDADGDGVLSRDVIESQSRGPGGRMLSRFDTDGDGAVSAEEFEAAESRMAEARGKRWGGHRGGPRGQ